MKLSKQDVGLDVNKIIWTLLQIQSDRSRSRIIFIRFESDYFLSYSNRIILPRIRSNLYRIRIILSSLVKVILSHPNCPFGSSFKALTCPNHYCSERRTSDFNPTGQTGVLWGITALSIMSQSTIEP